MAVCVYVCVRRARVCLCIVGYGTQGAELFLAVEPAAPLRLALELAGSDSGEALGGTGCSARSPWTSCVAETARS